MSGTVLWKYRRFLDWSANKNFVKFESASSAYFDKNKSKGGTEIPL